MNHVISVAMGDLKTGATPSVLETVGVGSCLAVVLYDPVALIGGLTHAILPSQSGGSTPHTDNKSRYVRESIEALLGELLKQGARKDRIIAKLVGGAHMFALFGNPEQGIGARNISEGRETLREHAIPIVAEETGGTVGRTLRFDLASGICSVETHM